VLVELLKIAVNMRTQCAIRDAQPEGFRMLWEHCPLAPPVSSWRPAKQVGPKPARWVSGLRAQPVERASRPGPVRFDLENENATIRNYRERVRQCEALGEFAMAEQIRKILVDEQDHQIDLATALGEEVPDLGRKAKR
jgi:hypothetical protein